MQPSRAQHLHRHYSWVSTAVRLRSKRYESTALPSRLKEVQRESTHRIKKARSRWLLRLVLLGLARCYLQGRRLCWIWTDAIQHTLWQKTLPFGLHCEATPSHLHSERCVDAGPFAQGCLEGAKIAASETARSEVCKMTKLLVSFTSLNDKREHGCSSKLFNFFVLKLVINGWSSCCFLHAVKWTF